MASEIGDLYRKLGFSAARRSRDDLAELFLRFSNARRRPGSELGQLLGQAADVDQVSERLAAEGVTDVGAFFAGRWNANADTPGDLLLERFLIRDLGIEEHTTVSAALERSPEARQLLDRLLKQRLIFLADHPAEPLVERVAALRAARASQPRKPPRGLPLRWVSVSVATAAVIALLGAGLLSEARPSEAVASVRASKPTARAPAPERPEPVAARAPVVEAPTVAQTMPRPPPAVRERGKARLIAYARAGTEVRSLEDGAELDADERVVTWVKTDEAGYAAVVSVEPERTRVFFADGGEAVAVPAGGPTRLGRARALPADDVELVLLVASKPFSVRPILKRMRRGVSPTSAFDGAVRRLRVRNGARELAGSQ